jgi:AcrR family transcriptional regulator
MSATKPRLPASERRAHVLGCACRVFSEGSYRGTTTAELAKAAGVTEPILYRHFDSKRELYLACLDASWADLRARWDEAIEGESDPALWLKALATSLFEAEKKRPVVSSLWIQALSEAAEDDDIRKYMRAHLREVHAYVTGVIERGQEAGGFLADRDARAEAWLFLSLGILKMASFRLGGLVDEDFPAIVAARRTWLTGRNS